MSQDEDSPFAPPEMKDDNEEKPDESGFVSTTLGTSEINLDDDEDENPFGETAKTQPKTESVVTNTVEVEKNVVDSSLDNEPTTANTDVVQENSAFPSVNDEPLVTNAAPVQKNAVYPTLNEELAATNAAPVQENVVYPTLNDEVTAFNNVEEQKTHETTEVKVQQEPLPVKAEEPPTITKTAATVFPDSPFHDEPKTPPASVAVTTPVEPKSTESKPTASFKFDYRSSTEVTKPASTKKQDISVVVHEPTKVGGGISSYMTYRIVTKTTLPQFKSGEISVNRRFSDFLGLHEKIVQKHIRQGILMPSPPEKDSVAMAKVKLSKDEGMPVNFLEHRRSYLQRYLNRLVQHPKLLEDQDVREFLENPNPLPKSTNTQAVSVESVVRVVSLLPGQVSKLLTKSNEQDEWFHDKLNNFLDIQKRLTSLFTQLIETYRHRKAAVVSIRNFSVFLNHLASVEEHGLVANALTEMANVQEKLEQIQSERTMREYSILTELVKEYSLMLDMVEMAFQTRIRLHQNWLACEDTLAKKRDQKVKYEQNPKSINKIPQAELEIQEWEAKVTQAKQEFEQISATLKTEVEIFDNSRFNDFKSVINQYLNHQLEIHERILNVWEGYLPHAEKINVN